MSEPNDTPGVKKTTRRFAPVKRGGKSPAAQRRAAAAAAAAAATATSEDADSSVKLEATESANASPSAESTSTEGHASAKSSPIGTIRPEGAGSGRLQSVNDGQKTRGGTMKVCRSKA